MPVRSSVAAFRALTAAILAAEENFLGPNRKWLASNGAQARLLKEIFPATMHEAGRIPEIETEAARSHLPINEFLAKHGLEIALEAFRGDEFGFAAVMTVAVEWLSPGEPRPVTGTDGIEYAGARLGSDRVGNGQRSVTFQVSPVHDQPVATILTKSGDLVRLTRFDENLDSFDLAMRSREIMRTLKPFSGFGGVHFPMIDADILPDLSWMIGLSTHTAAGQVARLVQAVQQFQLRMNHQGVVVRDGFAGAGVEESGEDPMPDLVLNGPFLFALQRPDLSLDVSTAVLRRDTWKDPGELVFT